MLKIIDMTFVHAGAAEALFSGVTVHFAQGWTGIVGMNGAGKTTLLRLACGLLEPALGRVEMSGRAVYCPQRTDDPPPDLSRFLASDDREAHRLKVDLDIADDWFGRWATLSHGERKRAQIGVALWSDPDILAIDEPTNHIDTDARRLLARALGGFRGTGLLVTHDRALLDTLCARCAFVEPPGIVVRPGGYTVASQQAAAERERDRHALEVVSRARARLNGEMSRRLADAGRADRKCSKRGLAPGDHDGRERINLARLSGKDGRAGRLAAQLGGRLERLGEEAARIQVRKEYRTGVWLDTEPARRNELFSIPAGEIELGPGRLLRHLSLSMGPSDRVGVTGRNGAGKSTLIQRIVGAADLPPGRVLYLPQEITATESARLISDVRALSREELGRVMTIVSRLGSRPPRLMETSEPSPGEMRKILLALGILRSPWLIVMDEPTNHLDLPAIECLEDALGDCPCGLLLVSHDEVFLRHLVGSLWNIVDGVLEKVPCRG
ncbi:MAG TPA: ATP-binding cassette domain-containing protein [Myxococcota bacterium]|nr:ATP-binding cassette domain-containing protein [Myxococcota bacterium]